MLASDGKVEKCAIWYISNFKTTKAQSSFGQCPESARVNETRIVKLGTYIFKASLQWIFRFLQPVIASWTTQNLINSCQAHLPVQFASNIEFIRQMWHWWCNWKRTTPESHVQNKLLVCYFGCPCSHWLFRFSVLYSNKTIIKYKIVYLLNYKYTEGL